MTYIPQEDQAAVVDGMARAIVRGFSPLALILFGSRARGDADEFSDADFLAVIDSARDRADLELEIGNTVSRFGMQAHVFVRTPQDFLREARVPGAMVYPAAREGVVLHEWPGWRDRFPVDNDPAADLARVLDREYRRRAGDYLAGARSHLALGALLRCRDHCRYAAVVALKGVQAMQGVHPPRDVDVAFQFRTAAALAPGLAALAPEADALHWAAPEDAAAAAQLVETAQILVRAALALYPEAV